MENKKEKVCYKVKYKELMSADDYFNSGKNRPRLYSLVKIHQVVSCKMYGFEK